MGAFIQDEILGMHWLHELIGVLLESLGIHLQSRWGGSLHFFLYDVIKISLLLGVLIFLVSYIQSFFPPERSRRIMGRFSGLTGCAVGALLGTVTPFCSCSSIPIFMGFVSAGLPLGVTFSFLISSPMVDLGSLILLASIFGWKIALIYVLLGLAVAILGGLLIACLSLEDEVQDFVRALPAAPETDDSPMTRRDRVQYAKAQVIFIFHKVFPYILLGVGLGAVIHNWIPASLVTFLLGGNHGWGVLLATFVGIPMYADIFGTIPIAEALLSKGAPLGTVLSFMMAVTTLSLPSLILLRQVVKPRLLAVFVAVCTVGILLVGYAFNALQGLW